MNEYAKTLLYVYPHLEQLIDNFDGAIEKKAINSFSDLSPCIFQAEAILKMIEQKDILINLKLILDEILSKFSKEDIMYFEYKYFKQKKKAYFFGFDSVSRRYFRKQIKLLNVFIKLLLKKGIDEEWFKNNCLEVGFIKEVYAQVKSKED